METAYESHFCENCEEHIYCINECLNCGKWLCDNCYEYNNGYCVDCKDYIDKENRAIKEELWRDFYNLRF